MSENEIKPVAWTSETQLSAVRKSGDGIMASTSGRWKIALYDQSAIDRLTAELGEYKMAADAEANQVDLLTDRVRSLTAERDAAVANRSRYFCDGPEGHFFCDDLELARALVNAYDKDDEWTITDILNPYGVDE